MDTLLTRSHGVVSNTPVSHLVVPGSILGPLAHHSENFLVFLSSSRQNAVILLKADHVPCLLPNPSQFIIQLISVNATQAVQLKKQCYVN
jgi:hypothetical protein